MFALDPQAAAVLVDLFEGQVQWSEVPGARELLVEQSPAPSGEGTVLTFHAPLHRAGCEAFRAGNRGPVGPPIRA